MSDGVFRGVTEDGQTMQVPLTSIKAARVREPNPGIWVLVGVAVAASALSAVVYLALHSQSGVENRVP